MSAIRYTDSVEGITAEQLEGLRGEWVNPPSAATTLKSLQHMNAVVLAMDEATDRVIGFVCGMTDETLILYVWDSDVLPGHRGQGIEKALLGRLLGRFGDIYQVNANPHQAIRPVFEELGFVAYAPADAVAVTKMDYDLQKGGHRAAR